MDTPSTITAGCTLTLEEHTALGREARREGISRSALIRRKLGLPPLAPQGRPRVATAREREITQFRTWAEEARANGQTLMADYWTAEAAKLAGEA